MMNNQVLDLFAKKCIDYIEEIDVIKKKNKELEFLVKIWKQRERFSSHNRSETSGINWCLGKIEYENVEEWEKLQYDEDTIAPFGCYAYHIHDGFRSPAEEFNCERLYHLLCSQCGEYFYYCDRCIDMNNLREDYYEDYVCFGCR